GYPALPHRRTQPAETMHLALGQRMLRVDFQTGVINLLDRWVPRQPFGNGGRVGAGSLHPQGEVLQAAEHKDAVESPAYTADRVVEKCHAFGQLAIFADDRYSADDVGMTIQVFRRRVHDDIDTEIEWTLHPWAGECIIYPGQDAALAGNLRNGLQVDQLQERVCGRLHPDQLCLGPKRRFKRV